MDGIKIFVSLALIAVTSGPLFARQVELQTFQDPLETYFAGVTSNSTNSVAAMMVKAFGGSFATQSPHAGLTGRDFTEPHIPELSICTPSAYKPAWWLPGKVERRRAAYFPLVSNIACQYGLPSALLDAVIAQESGYSSTAISGSGAMGIMQIMPGTARQLGLSSPLNPIANMHAGARYLRQQIDRFGRIDLALAAYNSGPERKSLNAGQIPAIPETMAYVRVITTNWARLAAETPVNTGVMARVSAADLAIKASGYREVDLSVYQGINASSPI